MDLKHRSKAVVEGDERACHRAYLRDLGLSDEEIARPFIGVINSRAKFHPGHAIPRTFSEEIKKGALLAGGTPFECNTWRGRGGIPAVLKEIESLLNTDVMTVSGSKSWSLCGTHLT